MVPEGWKEVSLASICRDKISYGVVQTGEHVPDGVPCLRVADLPNGRVESMIKTSVAISNSYKRTILQSNDIVLALRGVIGLACLVRDEWKGINITRGIARVAPDNSKILPEFLLWEFRSPRLRGELLRRAGGSALQEISLGELRRVTVLIPPLPEQEKIAKVLFTWDQAITTTEQILESSQQQKKALMQQLLTGKKRLKGHHRAWTEFKLEQLFSRVTTKNAEANTNVLTISAQHGLIRQEDFFSKIVASETLDNYFLLNKGEFAYNKSYSNGYPMGAIKRLNRYEKGVVTSLYICFKANNEAKCSPEFFEHYFESGRLNNDLRKIANEGGRAHGLLNVKPSDFFGLTVFIPEVAEQKEIAIVLNTADEEILTLRTKLSSLRNQKNALMQQLLTGKSRVKVDQLEVA